MNHPKTEVYFLFFLLAVVLILSFFIFQPFLYSLILAIVVTTVFQPINKKVLSLTHQNKGLSAFLTTLIVIIIVITPLTFLILQILKEATGLYSYLAVDGGLANLSVLITNKLNGLGNFIHTPMNFSINIDQYLKSVLDWLATFHPLLHHHHLGGFFVSK